MIKTFRHKGLQIFWETGSNRGIPPELAPRIRRRLLALDAAKLISDLKIPGFDLHQLKGNRAGEWSISVSGNWRITFRFVNGDAYDVNLEDYH